MTHPSLQVCIDSSDWLQGTMSDEISSGLDSSSSPSGDCMLAAACSSRAGPPLMERRLRPPHDQLLKCPRCESTHTKFCYYNNYSLSQPRYFCKTCRRYWTKGGTLRNIPVGGGCRKNKKSSSKKSNESGNHHQHQHQPLSQVVGGTGSPTLGPPTTNPMDLHLAFPEVQFPSHLANLIGAQMSLGGGGGGFMDNGLIRPIDFMESKYSQNFLGNNNNSGDHQFGGIMGGYNGISNGICSSSPFGGVSNCDSIHHDGSSGIGFMDQRLLLPYDANNDHHHHQGGIDVKPNPKLLSLEWHQDQGCSHANSDVVATKDSTTSFGYNVVNGALGSWSGMMGNFQPSTTNSLV